MSQFRNWAGQYQCSPRQVHRATCVEDVQHALHLAARDKSTLRVFGKGYSPSDIAMSDGHLLTVEGLNRIRRVDQLRVEAEAGVTLRQLDHALCQHGLALPYHSSIAEQSLAGVMATATHGTGLGHGVMPTWIRALELVTPDGVAHRITAEDPELFAAARCSLGSLGVHTAFTLEVSPAFELHVEEGRVAVDSVLGHLHERARSADHYRLWYLPHSHAFWEWRAWRKAPGTLPQKPLTWTDRIATWVSAKLIGYHCFEFLLWLTTLNPGSLPAVNRWFSRRFFQGTRHSVGSGLDQFTFDCKFRQYHDEWSIPLSAAEAGLSRLIDLVDRAKFPVHLPIEIRFMGKDDIWLSPNQGRDGCHIGIISYMPYGKDIPHEEYFGLYEELMHELRGRPHWAKMFTIPAEKLQEIYPHWDDFQRIRRRLDPSLLLRNAYTDRVLGGNI